MQIDPTNASTVTRWLFPVFTSEISFLFRLPIFLVPVLPADMVVLAQTQNYLKSTAFRVNNEWTEAVSAYEKRQAALYARPTLRKYVNFATVHTVFAILGLVLNFIWLVLWWVALENIAPFADASSHSAKRHYINQSVNALFHTHPGRAGSWILLASVLLYIVQYLHHRHHLVRLALHHPGHPETRLPRHLYILTHLSIINFLLDIPDINVPTSRFTRVFVVTANIIAGSVFVVAFVLQQPMTEAWGCYAPGTPYTGLKYGLCPRFLDDPQNVLPPVCDQTGVECGDGVARWKDMFVHDIHVAYIVLVVSFIVYLPLTLDNRIRFYRSATRFQMLISESPDKSE